MLNGRCCPCWCYHSHPPSSCPAIPPPPPPPPPRTIHLSSAFSFPARHLFCPPSRPHRPSRPSLRMRSPPSPLRPPFTGTGPKGAAAPPPPPRPPPLRRRRTPERTRSGARPCPALLCSVLLTSFLVSVMVGVRIVSLISGHCRGRVLGLEFRLGSGPGLWLWLRLGLGLELG